MSDLKDDKYWENNLTSEQYFITRKGGTERPFSGKFNDHKEQGIYFCICCNAELFDSNGKRIKFLPDPKNKNQLLPNEPRTKEEKNSLTPLHRLIFNLKKLIRMVPFGKTAFASYAVALALLKEQSNLDAEQTDQLFEDFYKLL